jgi:FixJ family two-component response regulator
MPEKDGLTLRQELSLLRPEIPMIMISGFLPRQMSQLKGVRAFLSKPLDKYALLTIIDDQLRL